MSPFHASKISAAYLIALSLCVSGPLCAGTIHVPGDSTTIQSAISGASAGDTVLVAPGTDF